MGEGDCWRSLPRGLGGEGKMCVVSSSFWEKRLGDVELVLSEWWANLKNRIYSINRERSAD
jgi:hypothetical protein